jgi:hypothetical protein
MIAIARLIVWLLTNLSVAEKGKQIIISGLWEFGVAKVHSKHHPSLLSRRAMRFSRHATTCSFV